MTDGYTFNEARDGDRLRRQLDVIKDAMGDGHPHTLAELARVAECSTASASARIRDMRKAKHGGAVIDRAYVGNGVWSYTTRVPKLARSKP